MIQLMLIKCRHSSCALMDLITYEGHTSVECILRRSLIWFTPKLQTATTLSDGKRSRSPPACLGAELALKRTSGSLRKPDLHGVIGTRGLQILPESVLPEARNQVASTASGAPSFQGGDGDGSLHVCAACRVMQAFVAIVARRGALNGQLLADVCGITRIPKSLDLGPLWVVL